MTTDYQADQGKKLFGTGVLLFGHGLIWFKSPGIFTLLPLSDRHGIFNIFYRAEIVIGVILAAYGLLVWRSAFRKLSLANCIIVLSCAPVLLLCVSKLSEWVYFLDQQRGFSILNELKVGVIQITVVVVSWFSVVGGPTAHACAHGFTDICDPADSSDSSNTYR
jgi:hypothetical protein